MNIEAVYSTVHPLAEDTKLRVLMNEATEFKRIFDEEAASQRPPAVATVNKALKTLLKLDHTLFQYVTSLSDERSVDQHFGEADKYLRQVEEAAEPLRRYVSTATIKP